MRTVERWRQDGAPQEDQRPHACRPAPSHKLTEEERQRILETTRCAEFQSLPPSQIVPVLADRGEYIASESSIYRILHEHQQQHHRGKAKNPAKRSEPTSHCAKAANEVWMWDISWLPGPVRGMYYYLYLILDLCFLQSKNACFCRERTNAPGPAFLLLATCHNRMANPVAWTVKNNEMTVVH